MTSVTIWSFLLLLIFLTIIPTETEVVDSVSSCSDFLLERTPPLIPGILEGDRILSQNRYKPICQTFKNTRRFLTLYDTENKIPVFSAHKFKGERAKRRPQNVSWMQEPQLEQGNPNMMDTKTWTSRFQASSYDYTNNIGYNKGHLYPSCHAYEEDDKISTFTLTNVVPQATTFNAGSWQKMETCVKCIMQDHCINANGVVEGFVVTGALPGQVKLNMKINIPTTLWTAFCCYSRKSDKWVAMAHWGPNIQDNGKSQHLPAKTLEQLKRELDLDIFPGTQCPSDPTDVAKLYPSTKARKRRCNCPLKPATTSAPPSTTTQSTTLAPTVSATTAETPLQTTISVSSTTINEPHSTFTANTKRQTTTLPATTKRTSLITTTTTTTTTTRKTIDEQDNNGGGGQTGINANTPGGGFLGGLLSFFSVLIGSLSGAGAASLGGAPIKTSIQIPTTAFPTHIKHNTQTTTGTTVFHPTAVPKTNTAMQRSTNFIPTTAGPRTNTTIQTSTPSIPAPFQLKNNTTAETWTTSISTTEAQLGPETDTYTNTSTFFRPSTTEFESSTTN